MIDLDSFFDSQIAVWPEAAARYAALADVRHKTVSVDGCGYKVVFNPARAVSTQARVDAAAIAARPCFLCAVNRPASQRSLPWRDYEILVNPYPLFDRHFTVAAVTHQPQLLSGRFADMLELAFETGYTLFYNGATCGASAPDHMHFQAVPADSLTACRDFPFRVLRMSVSRGDGDDIAARFSALLGQLPISPGATEPAVNVIVTPVTHDKAEVVVIPRRAHRPACFGAIMVSPASVDLGGMVVTTRQSDFDAVDSAALRLILSDVTYLKAHESVDVGVMTAPDISYSLTGPFDRESDAITPLSDDSLFTLDDVTIGVGFHWERRERQSFRGALMLRDNDDGTVTAINRVPVEEYLMSVISSEMSARASIELLKAHAVISRSWLLAQIDHKGCCRRDMMPVPTDAEIVRWYDHDDHVGFDVCADDHCQRYQGITRECTPRAARAVYATWGEVLTYGGQLCDARFSKCCGGVFEEFGNCWEPVGHPYLVAGADTPHPDDFPDLRDEAAARRWIMSSPESFCNTTDSAVLDQVLNDYDRETPDFYRWRVTYTPDELSAIVRDRSGIDFGAITALVPLSRGTSGRITRLRVEGTRRCVIVGKELEIRRWLSRSHLYSSAFVVDRDSDGRFVLTGAGWGHGVGLCQIGAAMMASRGYGYREILSHYFRGASVTRRY
ncbi:MAG: DUF4922 domain-containing protein [Pseudoflavonifractor sp.]|nr:DUF4922 domain-containing protein [Pseudoflavonifractor sp.]